MARQENLLPTSNPPTSADDKTHAWGELVTEAYANQGIDPAHAFFSELGW